MRIERSPPVFDQSPAYPREEWLNPLRSKTGQIWRFLLADPLNLVGSFIVLFVLLLGIFGPLVAPYDPIEPVYTDRLQAPSYAHPFGTDEVGRDLFSRVIHGARISLGVGTIILLVAVSIGSVMGTIAGLSGGLIDEIMMRTTDMFLAFPSLILAMAIAATLGASLENSLIALAIAWWPWYSRLVRGEVLRIREREYVLASQSSGGTKWHIIREHIWPNILTPVLVQMSMDFGYAILATAGLSFIGLGAQAPSPEWGLTIWTARTFIRESWWYITFPGLALMITVLGFNLLGDGLRDFLDPRVRRNERA